MASQEIFEIGEISEAQEDKCLIYDIVDGIFQRYEESESQPEAQCMSGLDISHVDKRLLYWKDMIQKRRALQRRLCLATGRQPEELLFNLDNREEQTFKRILDHTSRKDILVSNESLDYVEIVGLPKRISEEMDCPGPKRNSWGESQMLATCLQLEKTGIRNVLEFCPKVDQLMLVGRNLWRRQPCMRTSGHTISSITPSEVLERPAEKLAAATSKTRILQAAASELAVSFNGTTYRRHRPEFSPIVERKFVSNPYEYSYRTIIRIENNGRELINFRWSCAESFAYNRSLFSKPDDVFVFDKEPFPLRPGGVREVSVLFRPRKVGIVKQRWLLKTSPRIFFRCPYALTLNMHGKCTPPQEYLQLLRERMLLNRTYATKRVARPQAMPKPLPILCPYVRQLEDNEAFNQRNVGFHCEREHDMRDLKRFFYLVRPENCGLEWDYSVSLLIELVCIKGDTQQRISLFEQLQSLLAPLRGRTTPLKLSDSVHRLKQRQCTKFIFVRGIIANGIELWEQQLSMFVPQICTKGSWAQKKSLRDAIYIYTFYRLCNIAENIVSVIESTEHV
ncbi:PREDICTED: uncharacterized protein LOC108616899 [Drosophila arizonae]|uniref:Uncharacterized protein LOC108616899 n=1 Tax=Drosophila arizonae TaxID=7263 RepID=A0ABM1PL20_DROAR|nr:PREDICTED: uncharacterized protein LOC108616899 [Drosophila arizonae]